MVFSKVRIFVGLALITTSFVATAPASAADAAGEPTITTECHAPKWKTLGRKLTYCIEKITPAGYVETADNPVRTLFFMHGIFGDHKAWFEGWDKSFEKFARADGRPWAAISFDTAPISFFSDYRGKTHGHSAYETWFAYELVPEVTRIHHLCDHRECRGLVAESMGGFGVLKASLRYPEMFSAVATSSPALPARDPFDNFFDWSNYFAGKPIGRAAGSALIVWARTYFLNPAYFSQIDPIELVERFDDRAYPFPKMYIQCGGHDKYGFEDGFKLLREALDHRGFQYEANFYPDEGHFLPGASDALLGFLFRNL